MEKAIMNALAVRDNKCGGANIQFSENFQIYLKNAYVSLKSAKMCNPNTDVVLVINFDMPDCFTKVFLDAGIIVEKCDFHAFRVPDHFKWSLAFYKLCALKFLLENRDYDKILLLDTDTISVHDVDDVWEEAEESLLLFNVHSLYHNDVRENIRLDYEKFYNERRNLQHYGGEFICGNRANLETFLENCGHVYQAICNSNFDMFSLSGDELIISAAVRNTENLSEANPYIMRYWTGMEYIADTRCHYQKVSIWHIPSEKEFGMLTAYNYLLKHDNLPSKVYKWFGLPKPHRPDYLKYLLKKIIKNKGKRL